MSRLSEKHCNNMVRDLMTCGDQTVVRPTGAYHFSISPGNERVEAEDLTTGEYAGSCEVQPLSLAIWLETLYGEGQL